MVEEWKAGGCHCGQVKFRARRDWSQGLRCNCSVCFQKGFLHGIVPDAKDFELVEGKAGLSEYRFNTKVARHLFCARCGVSPFYVPRSHPEGVSVNLRCVPGLNLGEIRWADFDGQNWERARSDLGEF